MKPIVIKLDATNRKIITFTDEGFVIGYQYKSGGRWWDDQDSGASLTWLQFNHIQSERLKNLDSERKRKLTPPAPDAETTRDE